RRSDRGQRLAATPGRRGDQPQILNRELGELLGEPLSQHGRQLLSVAGEWRIGTLAEISAAGARLGRAVAGEEEVTHLGPSLPPVPAYPVRYAVPSPPDLLPRTDGAP